MRGDLIKAELLNQAFAVCPTKMQTYMNVLNDNVPRVQDDTGVSNNNVVYATVDNIAVISIDGAMYKKGFNGACGETVVSYPDIVKAIDIAEKDNNIETIVFRVDTPGGSVAGAEEVRYRIKNSDKKTVTFYENLGASGGIWIFTASDEMYAAPTTWLGSVGVVVAYEEDDGETKRVELVSKNAPNKRCNLNGDCKEKMQGMIDQIESDFFMVIEENTSFSKEKIIDLFDNGGIIKAEIAKEQGFIKDISQFSVLLSNLKSTTGVSMSTPSAESTPVIGGFTFTEENFKVLVEGREKSTETISALNTKVTDLEAKLGSYEVAKNTMESIDTRVALAVSHNITNAETISNIIKAETSDEAIKMAIDAKEDTAVVVNQDEPQAQKSEIEAFYEAKKQERRY